MLSTVTPGTGMGIYSAAVRQPIETLGLPELHVRRKRLGDYTLDAPRWVCRHWEAVK